MAIKEIQKILNVSRPTTTKILKNVENKKRGVKPHLPVKKIENKMKIAIANMRKQGKKRSASYIKSEIQTDYSLRSIQRFLQNSPTFK